MSPPCLRDSPPPVNARRRCRQDARSVMSPLQDPHRSHAATPGELVALNAMHRSERPFLAWRDDEGALQMRALDGESLTIGRAPSSGIPITWDPAVSSLHAELIALDSEWLIVDDGVSRNGTFVGQRRVSGRLRLRDEDRIRVGETLLVFHRPVEIAEPTAFADGGVAREDLSDTEWAVLRALCRPMVLEGRPAAASNNAIVEEVHLSLDGVKRCLTRLYGAFAIGGEVESKRLGLAHAAINGGLVTVRAYE